MSEATTNPMTEADLEQMARWFLGTEGYYRVARLIAEVRRLRQQAAEKPLAWTKEPPTVPGYWWYREGPNDEPSVHQVLKFERVLDVPIVTMQGDEAGRSFMVKGDGEWSGPLTPPES